MISPAEIKVQALKWWKPFLQSTLRGEAFFPRLIDRIGKVQAHDITTRFEELQKRVELLYRHSKAHTGVGYLVRTEARNFRRTGSHELPEALVFETTEDFISFTGKKREWAMFLSNCELIRQSIPQLHPWMIDNCTCLTESGISWPDVLRVCHYFIQTPRPGLYIRQLPVDVHTKFIEENASLIQSLLDFLIPDDIRDKKQKRLAERYFLRYDEPLIRIRFLDERLCRNSFSDISISLSDFEKFNVAAGNVLIAENKMNFLSLPPLVSTVAVWSGGGFNISYLRNARWLAGKNLFYWGDIDEHGFQILHQLRSYYPACRSIMMDRATYQRFEAFAAAGARNTSDHLSLLSPEESELYNLLRSSADKNRLEQEKIPQPYAEMCLQEALQTP